MEAITIGRNWLADSKLVGEGPESTPLADSILELGTERVDDGQGLALNTLILVI